MDRDEAKELAHVKKDIFNSDYYYTDLTPVVIEHPTSRLLVARQGLIWTFAMGPLEGLFEKTNPTSIRFGRLHCDMVKKDFNCGGFFTTEELPAYGIKRSEKKIIDSHFDKQKGDGKVVVILAYDKQLATEIRSYLIEYFSKLFSTEDLVRGNSPQLFK